MAFVVKMSCLGDVRRKRFASIAEVTLESINASVRENYGFGSFIAKYSDDEGDLCSLTAWTLQDALELTSKNILKLEITEVPEQVPAAREIVVLEGAPAPDSFEAESNAATDAVRSASSSAGADFEIVDASPSRRSLTSEGEGSPRPVASEIAFVDAQEPKDDDGNSCDDEEASPLRLPDNVIAFAINTPARGSTPCQRGARTPTLPPSEDAADSVELVLPGSPNSQHDEITEPSLQPGSPNSQREEITEPNPQRDEITEPAVSAEEAHEPAGPGAPNSEPSAPDSELGTPSFAGEQSGVQPESAPPSAPPREEEENAEEPRLTESDKILIVLAAFDANGDGRLSLDECNALQRASWGGHIDREAYAAICAELGADAATGLAAEDLDALYACYGTLDRDFAAALARLQGRERGQGDEDGEDGERGGQEEAAPAGQPSQPSQPGLHPMCRIAPLLAIPMVAPLVLTCPLIGVPLAIHAVRRYSRS